MASLPQNDPNPSERNEQLLNSRQTYQFRYDFESLPGVPMAREVPWAQYPTFKWIRLALEKALAVFDNNLRNDDSPGRPEGVSHRDASIWRKFLFINPTDVMSIAQEVIDLFTRNPEAKRPQDLKDYDELFKTLSKPLSADFFQEDAAFGRMRVAGQNPLVLKKVSALDASFPVNDELYQSVSGFGGDTLQQAIAQNRLYIADYSMLTILQNGNAGFGQKYAYAPKALFAIPQNPASLAETLMPITIQCAQTPESSHGLLFTPNDGQAWSVAKAIVQSADFSDHEIVSHLCKTHLFIEPFIVATHRQLAEKHPLFKLLTPHFEGTLFINWQAEQRLVNNGGTFDQAFGGTIQSYRELASKTIQWDFKAEMFPHQMAARGLDNPTLYSPYQHDAGLLWDAIHSWMEGFLSVYYHDDNDVQRDIELQSWVAEMISINGGRMGNFDESDGKIHTLAYLADAITMIIFTASVQHAAVNFTQYDFSGYPPTMPAAGYRPIPTSKELTKQDYLDYLPPLNMAELQLSITALLSGVNYTQLGQYKLRQFDDERVLPHLRNFDLELASIETKIGKRNAQAKEVGMDPYNYLLPEDIPQSINI